MAGRRRGRRPALPWVRLYSSHSVDGALLPWLEALALQLDEAFPLPPGKELIPEATLLPPRVKARTEDKAPTAPTEPAGLQATLTTNRRMTAAEHWQDVRFLELALDPTTPVPAYQAGDVVSLFPANAPDAVQELLDRLAWADQADTQLVLTNTDRPLPAALAQENSEGSLTLRRLLTHYVDPFSVPRRSFFELIQHFSPADHREREKLAEFLVPGEGTDDMYEYAQRVRRTMAEVLAEFTSVMVPVEYVMELFPLLRERQFSIASAPSVRPHPNPAFASVLAVGGSPGEVQNAAAKAARGDMQCMARAFVGRHTRTHTYRARHVAGAGGPRDPRAGHWTWYRDCSAPLDCPRTHCAVVGGARYNGRDWMSVCAP